MTDINLNEAVAAGAQWLDENVKGWERKIDLTILDIDDGCRCILGQIFSTQPQLPLTGFGIGTEIAIKQDYTWSARAHGFLGLSDAETSALDEAWISLIKERFNTGNLSDNNGTD